MLNQKLTFLFAQLRGSLDRSDAGMATTAEQLSFPFERTSQVEPPPLDAPKMVVRPVVVETDVHLKVFPCWAQCALPPEQ
jgi:hypothetical protein